MENDYLILQNAQRLIEKYLKNPNSCDPHTTRQAFDDLGELLLRSKHEDILEKGHRTYFQFLFESEAFSEDYKQELRHWGQEQLKKMPGLEEATKSVH